MSTERAKELLIVERKIVRAEKKLFDLKEQRALLIAAMARGE